MDIVFAIISWIFFIIGKLAIVWGPILALYIAFEFWHHFVVDRFISGITWSLLEVEVPRDILKSPLAMELIFSNAMYQMSNKGLWEVWIQGAVHLWFSLEIVSTEGRVHFYIRTADRIKPLLEAQIYGQYPQAKIVEVEDYTLRVPYDVPNDDWYMWGCEFKLADGDFYPIKTYVNFGLDENPKEEEKIDPLTPTVEFLGSLTKGQHIWTQIIVRATEKHYHQHGTLFKHHGWVEEGNHFLKEIMIPYTKKGINYDGSTSTEIRMPKIVEDKVKAIKEKLEKIGFDCGIRVIVLSEKKYVTQDAFNNLRRASRLMYRQYTDPDTNRLERVKPTQFDSPFADPTGKSLKFIKHRMLFWYRTRTFFHPAFWYAVKYPAFVSAFFPSHRPEPFVLNSEELATLFHFPGQVSQTPTFKRLESRTAKPPTNLPI